MRSRWPGTVPRSDPGFPRGFSRPRRRDCGCRLHRHRRFDGDTCAERREGNTDPAPSAACRGRLHRLVPESGTVRVLGAGAGRAVFRRALHRRPRGQARYPSDADRRRPGTVRCGDGARVPWFSPLLFKNDARRSSAGPPVDRRSYSAGAFRGKSEKKKKPWGT